MNIPFVFPLTHEGNTFVINDYFSLFAHTAPGVEDSARRLLGKREDLPFKILKIELIEINDIITPSPLSVSITTNTQEVIHLFRHRNEFIYQNGIFMWDVSKLKSFEINVQNNDYFRIEIGAMDLNGRIGGHVKFGASLYGSVTK